MGTTGAPETDLQSWRAMRALLAPERSDSDDAGRRLFVGLCLALGIPTLVGFAVIDFVVRLYVDAAAESAAVVMLSGVVVALRRDRNPLPAYRVTAAGLIGLFVYLVATGHETAALLWLYTFPPAAYFLLGTREGAVWTGALVLLATAAGVAASRLADSYAFSVLLRLFVSLTLVSILAHGLESLRARSHERLARRNMELARALAEVRTLSGLLPICASCKKIRDDEGYWQGVEEYIESHTHAAFTHSICPGCAERLYGVQLPEADGGPKPPPQE